MHILLNLLSYFTEHENPLGRMLLREASHA